jgi:hypothetical protein
LTNERRFLDHYGTTPGNYRQRSAELQNQNHYHPSERHSRQHFRICALRSKIRLTALLIFTKAGISGEYRSKVRYVISAFSPMELGSSDKFAKQFQFHISEHVSRSGNGCAFATSRCHLIAWHPVRSTPVRLSHIVRMDVIFTSIPLR